MKQTPEMKKRKKKEDEAGGKGTAEGTEACGRKVRKGEKELTRKLRRRSRRSGKNRQQARITSMEGNGKARRQAMNVIDTA